MKGAAPVVAGDTAEEIGGEHGNRGRDEEHDDIERCEREERKVSFAVTQLSLERTRC